MRNTHVYTLLLGNGIELGWFSGRGEFDLDLFDLQQSLKSGSYTCHVKNCHVCISYIRYTLLLIYNISS